jgi:orotidine-5'-phosphate decarboxylase
MGRDSVEPFLQFEGKYVILLALTSNAGAFEFQTLSVGDQSLYEQVIETASTWENADRLMYVVGATKAEHLAVIRQKLPNQFLLIPGVGAQGGSLTEVCKYGMTDNVGLLVNSSRGIIYASSGEDFATAAAAKAADLQQQMATVLHGV